MGYKMKGFSGFKNSPAKVSDSEVVAAQRRLNKIEGSYRAPGWEKAAGAIHKNILTGGWAKASGRSDVAEDIYDRPTGGGTAAGGGGGNKSVGSTISEMKQVTGDAKGIMADVKDIGKGFGDLFKGAKKAETPGSASTEPALSYEDFKAAGYN
jgi:hypothetical protein